MRSSRTQKIRRRLSSYSQQLSGVASAITPSAEDGVSECIHPIYPLSQMKVTGRTGLPVCNITATAAMEDRGYCIRSSQWLWRRRKPAPAWGEVPRTAAGCWLDVP